MKSEQILQEQFDSFSAIANSKHHLKMPTIIENYSNGIAVIRALGLRDHGDPGFYVSEWFPKFEAKKEELDALRQFLAGKK